MLTQWSNRWYVLVLSLALLMFALGTGQRNRAPQLTVPLSVYAEPVDRTPR
ncbi:MAG: hypothetical protein VXY23_09710 [Pseudomonadota bacterium]|nr:hypothetical protein [Pseudomonadota bacterium]